jgi:mono/diheme cytochrome c family protein
MTRTGLSAGIACLAVTVFVSARAADTAQPHLPAFEKVCAKCHREGGTGTFMLERRLGKEKALLEDRNDLQPEFIRHVVRNGILSMPAITRVEVTDAELDVIVRYLARGTSRDPENGWD